jgi:hypothetical protein
VGYPTAIVLVARFGAVVRLRQLRLFLTHQAAMVAVITGWALLGHPLGVALNTAWFAGAAAWWLWRR